MQRNDYAQHRIQWNTKCWGGRSRSIAPLCNQQQQQISCSLTRNFHLNIEFHWDSVSLTLNAFSILFFSLTPFLMPIINANQLFFSTHTHTSQPSQILNTNYSHRKHTTIFTLNHITSHIDTGINIKQTNEHI